jgi:hypothetical protein
MKAHPFSENRRTHVQQLIDLVESTGPNGITVAKLQSVFALKYGNTKRTVESYLEDADGTGLIVTDGVKWYAKGALQKKNLNEYLVEGYVLPRDNR